MSQSAKPSKYLTAPSVTEEKMPKGIPYIIGNEMAERFSFYGMRTILVIFMTRYLHYMVDGEVGAEMSKAAANARYHDFVAYTYFFPVLGSFLSDVFLGKYRTILWLSIVYCLGHLALALMGGAGLSPASWLTLGLVLIAIGSGGIKPCVSAHVGDQFGPKNSHLMSRVFQWFYFAINFGSTFSTILTPVLLKWYGPHIAFGVPGVLMALATLMFWMGRHVFVHVPPSGKSFFRETFSREGVFALLKLSIIYAFVAVFWSLFDQTGSSWVLQAENMDRNFLGVEWLESQIQVINPVLVLILIPLFQFVIYPAVDRVFKMTAIRKISIGLFFAAAGFMLITMAQARIDQGGTPSIAWQIWAYVLLTSAEIMISITGLEFSYTQAPKSMKSVVMAVWLFSVSLGNIFASGVNNYIQVPGVGQIADSVKELKVGDTHVKGWHVQVSEQADGKEGSSRKRIQVSGYDGEYGTADDITMKFSSFYQLDSVETSENESLEQAAEKINQAFFDSSEDPSAGQLPSNELGQELLASVNDLRKEPLTYKQLSKNAYRITSPGADFQQGTRWDVVLTGTVSRVDAKASSSEGRESPYDWLEKRIIEVRGEEGEAEVKRARGDIPKTSIDVELTVGGQDTLEGADYFKFWTNAILVTAILFIPVGYLYKEKSYIQSEDGSA
jgi:POT family proton-dependent oligopeptide transporter